MSELIRADVIGMTDEEVVYGWHRGGTSELIIVSGAEQQLLVVNSTVDPEGFGESVRRAVPPELQDGVSAWLEQGDPDQQRRSLRHGLDRGDWG